MLIIIDLQKPFLLPQSHAKSRSRLQRLERHVTQQIADAKKRRQPIVIVEYQGEGKTVDWVSAKIGKYKKVYKVKKGQDNAYPSLRRCFDKHKIAPKKLTVCGVNTHYCVGSTLKSLVKEGYGVTVPWGAVDCCEKRYKQREFLNGFGGELKVI